MFKASCVGISYLGSVIVGSRDRGMGHAFHNRCIFNFRGVRCDFRQSSQRHKVHIAVRRLLADLHALNHSAGCLGGELYFWTNLVRLVQIDAGD